MDLKRFNEERRNRNQMLADLDRFFSEFAQLDGQVYRDGAIPAKYKELTGLSISVLSRCEECIAYHMQQCKEQDCSTEEIVEAIKMGVIGGGSVTYPWARKAVAIMRQLEIA